MITKHPQGYIINDSFLFTSSFVDGYINLFSRAGESDISLTKQKVINYAGEYEIEGYHIIASDKNGLLSYYIAGEKPLLLLQSDDILSMVSVENISDFIVSTSQLKTKLESMEISGNFYVMDEN